MPLRLGRRTFGDDETVVMAIVNHTPDSFYDRGATFADDAALAAVDRAVAEGGGPRRRQRGMLVPTAPRRGGRPPRATRRGPRSERRVTLPFMIAAIAVVAVVALLAVGRLGELPEADADRAPLALPVGRPMDRADVDGVRFAVGLRGYRMDQVDQVLDELRDQIARKDREIARLRTERERTAPERHADSAPDPAP